MRVCLLFAVLFVVLCSVHPKRAWLNALAHGGGSDQKRAEPAVPLVADWPKGEGEVANTLP